MNSTQNLETPKTHELTAEYSKADHKVKLRLWRRGDPERSADPLDEAELTPGRGYDVELRLKRRAMLERNDLTERQVLGA